MYSPSGRKYENAIVISMVGGQNHASQSNVPFSKNFTASKTQTRNSPNEKDAIRYLFRYITQNSSMPDPFGFIEDSEMKRFIKGVIQVE